MAGDWIKWVKGLSRKSEVLSMALTLKTDRRIVASACMELWEWADTETVDGHIRGADYAFIDGLVAFPGFARAIESVGWLRSTEQGITLSRWDRHNGESAKKRAKDNDRKRSIRTNKQAVPEMSAFEADKNRTREEKRREEKSKTKTPTKEVSPQGGDSLRIVCDESDEVREEREAECEMLLRELGIDGRALDHLPTVPGITPAMIRKAGLPTRNEPAGTGLVIYRLCEWLHTSIPSANSISPEVKRIQSIVRSRRRHIT
jgi:hypothetical protein